MKNFLKIHKNKILFGALIFLAALGVLAWLWFWELEHRPELAVYFFDVGQGDAIFIEAKEGTQILIDGGPSLQVLSQLARVMPYYDRSIDIVILTHPHSDHVTGLIDILKRYKVGMIIESGVDYHTAEAKEFERLVGQENLKKIVIDHPITLSFYNGATLKFIYPDKSFLGKTFKNVHDAMVVSELDFEGKKILLMGDAEKNIERYLVNQKQAGDVDVLKAGHHGSKTSSNDFFLKTVKPEYAVISVGAKNRYGHPHPDVLSRLAAAGAQIFRTDINGTIVITINGGKLILQKEK